MHKEIKWVGLVLLSFTTFLCSALCSTPVCATESSAYRLQVSPTQLNLGTMSPGSTYTGSFLVQNTGTSGYAYKLSIAPYSVQNASYDPNFINHSNYTEITDWITLPVTDGYVEANSNQRVEFAVTIPEDAPANGQNAAIMVTLDMPADATSSGIKTTRQIAFLLYGNVDGATRRTAEVIKNEIPSFWLEPPVTFSATVKNTGNIYTTAKYEIEVRGLTDGRIVYSNSGEKNGQVLFPETERDNVIEWSDAPTMGIFRAKQTITIFDETSTTEKLIFIFPSWFIGIMVTLCGLILAWIAQKIHSVLEYRHRDYRNAGRPPVRRPRRVMARSVRSAAPARYYTWTPSERQVPSKPRKPS